jgi:hypothetical protein
MLGAGLKWNIWDWSKSKREQMILEHQKNQIDHSRESFEHAIQLQLEKEEANIEQYRKTLDLDYKMLHLQKEITLEAASQLENGTITVSDYILEANKESMARIRADADNILLIRAIANYMTLKGTL